MTEPTADLVRMPELLAALPSPRDLKSALVLRLEQAFHAAKVARGPVHVPEDTFALQRSLAAVFELARDYQAVFATVRRTVAQMQEEELADAVGEQDGKPNQGLTVPDPEGDIRLSLANDNTHTIDADALRAVVVANLVHRDAQDLIWEGSHQDLPRMELALGATLDDAITAYVALGKFEPQVSKVKAYGKDLARRGEDSLAGAVGTTIRTTTTYKGVAFERKQS